MRRAIALIILLAAPAMAQTSRPASEAADRFGSLRRSVENVSDLEQIVNRYQLFIKTYKGTAVEADAVRDLATWQDRLDKKMLKVGGKWITPEERAGLAEQSLEAADNVRQLLKQGRLKEADSALKTALDVNSKDPALLYLSGVLAYRQDQLSAGAKRRLRQSTHLFPNHAPTLNNLAVILFRQKQYAGALALYDQAMNASPGNKDILNNVAEALDALPETEQNGPAAKKIMRRFTEQETKLGKEMNAQNMYRWGATWVTQEQMTELQAHEREIKDRLDQLAAQFDSQKITIADIEKNLKEANRQIGNLDNTGYVRASTARFTRAFRR
jgi:tetratricopeptide (TPR) repeat protein